MELCAVRKSACLLMLALGSAHAGVAQADLGDPVITEWEVPWERSRPRDPYVDASGLVWFVGQRGDYVASLDPRDGSFRRLALDDGTGPHNLVVAGDDRVWYAGNRASHIGRLDADTGRIEKVSMPDPRARDPHTLVLDDSGDIWFSVQGGNFVGKLATEARRVSLVPVPTPNARPYGIIVGRDGAVWATAFGTNKLLRVDPETLDLTEIVLRRSSARPRRLDQTSDGAVWYVDYSQGYLGRLDPASGSIDEWRMPSGSASRPYGMAVDARDRVWMVETGPDPNRFVGFDPGTEAFFSSVPIPSGGGSVRHMHYHEPTNTVWFGTDTNTIGRARLPE